MDHQYGVSVIIPVYRDFGFLDKVINSVIDSCIGFQFEIIVVDDFSDNIDYLLEMEKKYSCINLVLSKKKGNAAISRNIGLDISKYRFVFFLDSDDFFVDTHVNHRVKLHKEKKEGFIFGQFVTAFNGNKLYSTLPHPKSNLCDYLFFEGGDVRTSTFSLDKENLISALRFDDLSFKHQDWIFACLAAEQYYFDNKHGVIINVMHGTNMSMNFDISSSKYLIDKYLLDERKVSKFSRPNCINSVVANNSNAYIFFMNHFKPLTKKDHFIKLFLLIYKLPLVGYFFHKSLLFLKKKRWR